MTIAPTTARLSLADVWRREWYLFQFSWPMQDYPGKAYKQIKTDLRAQLSVAAGDVGMRRAVADLGHPTVLAEQYVAELGRRLPRWRTGATTAAVVAGLILYLAMAYAFGTLDTLDALGGGSLTRFPFGAETVFTHTDDQISVATRPSVAGTAFVVVTSLVAFVLGSRAWRALP